MSPMIERETDAPTSQQSNTMPAKNASKVTAPRALPKSINKKADEKELDLEEDFQRPPDSSDEDERDLLPIKSTVFTSKVAEKKSKPPQSKKETGAGRTNCARGTTKSKGKENSSSSSASTNSQKRKTQDDLDEFGNMPMKKSKVKAKYGSSQRSYGSKPSSQAFKTSSATEFKRPDDSSGEENVTGRPLKSKFDPGEDLPPESPEKDSGFIKPDSDSEDSEHDPKSSLKSRPRRLEKAEPPATQPSVFKFYDDLDIAAFDPLEPMPIEIVETLRGSNSLEANAIFQDLDTESKNEEISIDAKDHRCPMCNETVDADDLKAYGHMNTRAQEKFCRMHRKKSATRDWSTKGYPEIKWEQLDARVKGHHAFIRKLINGADSHYREILQDKVNRGKDRNFRKMTSNLTPGYYGSRGLRLISENIMAKFTPLLKKQMVQDPLMSARGFTPFVQAVIVPEITVLLIQEDMDVDVEEAREILSDSATLGELLNEELREVVTHEVDDSDEEEFDELA